MAGALVWSCGAGSSSRFPLADPLWVDADKRPFSGEPEEYFSPFGWDGADQTVFRPLSRFFAGDRAGEAVNVNAVDEVPDSSWFQNRIGLFAMSPERLARGPCVDEPLDTEAPWIVKDAKPNGANPGFVIKAPDGKRYLIKFDGDIQGPRATAADVIGTRLYYAAGYYTPCNRVVYFDRSILRIDPEASVEEPSGGERAMTSKDLDQVFSKALRLRDGRYRASSSLYLEGKPLGPWQFQGTRDDDPNDVVRHEDRRELRGMRVLAAWIHHFDSREQNTLAMWVKTDKHRGYVRHTVLDFGDSLGSLWEPPELGRRIGHAYYLDIAYVLEDWLTFGLVERPWDGARFGPSGPVFGYFAVEDFDPDLWRPGYPNPAFGRMREHDAAWMARIIARFSDAHIRALVETADLGDGSLNRELLRILIGRRDRILRRYLGRLSPLTLPELDSEGGARLCLEDLLVSSLLSTPEHRRYRFVVRAGDPSAVKASGPVPGAGSRVCIPLPDVRGQKSPPEYLTVDVLAGQSARRAATANETGTTKPSIAWQPPTRVHLYQTARARYRVVGLERLDSEDFPE